MIKSKHSLAAMASCVALLGICAPARGQSSLFARVVVAGNSPYEKDDFASGSDPTGVTASAMAVIPGSVATDAASCTSKYGLVQGYTSNPSGIVADAFGGFDDELTVVSDDPAKAGAKLWLYFQPQDALGSSRSAAASVTYSGEVYASGVYTGKSFFMHYSDDLTGVSRPTPTALEVSVGDVIHIRGTADVSYSALGTFSFYADSSTKGVRLVSTSGHDYTGPGIDQGHPRLPDGFLGLLLLFFDVVGQSGGPVWIDPPTTYGYTYTMVDGSLFTSIADFPTGFSSAFTVSANGKTYGTYVPGQSVIFDGDGVSSFTITGITPRVDGTSPTAFPVKIAFNRDFASFTMEPIDGPADATPPTSLAQVTPDTSNSSGWSSSVISVSLSATDNPGGSGVKRIIFSVDGGATAEYVTPIAISMEGIHNITFRAEDNAGNVENDKSIAVKIDETAPTTTASGDDGSWHNADVSLTLTASDNEGGSGINQIRYKVDDDAAWSTYTGALRISSEGIHTVTFRAEDVAGNIEPDKTVTIRIDKTSPSITAADVNVAATTATGTVVSFASLKATDSLSGVVGNIISTPASGSQFPLGTTTVYCSVSDAAGNIGTATFKVTVTYSWSSILQPINPDGSSVFKSGSTVPVKFQLTGVSAGITNAVANLSYSRVGDASAAINEAVSVAVGDSGNQFRYDSSSQQYIFNMSTKGMASGKYLLSVDLHDGVSRTVQISLK